jgi:hypothetical protein
VRLEVRDPNFACFVSPLPFTEYLAVELIFHPSSKHMDKHERPYICTVDGCDHPQGFTSKGDLSRHRRIVHKLNSGQGGLLFCNEPNKRRRISETGLSSQNADQGDEEKIYLRSELGRMTQRVEELTKELKEVQKKCDEKTEVLVGIIERLTQQSK